MRTALGDGSVGPAAVCAALRAWWLGRSGELIRGAALPLAGALLGFAAFSGPWPLLGLGGAMPLLLVRAESRSEAFVTALAYQTAASRGLALGAAHFFGTGLSLGVLIWLVGSAVSAAVYGLVWMRSRPARAVSTCAAVVALAVPPLGAFGWASPLSAAGVLFPGVGILGLALTLAITPALAGAARWPALLLAGVSVSANLAARPPALSHAEGLLTNFGPPAETFETDYERQLELVRDVSAASAPMVVLPESSLMAWNAVTARFWGRNLPQGKAVAIGTVVAGSRGQRAKNVLVFLSHEGQQVYEQRQPVPLSMWRPFWGGGYEASWSAAPVITSAGRKVAPLICYEAFLVWPAVESLAAGGEELVTAANLWWAQGTVLPELQMSLVASWARLFHVPFTLAVNE